MTCSIAHLTLLRCVIKPREKIRIQLEKDRLYFPDNIKLQLKNSGNIDIDLDRPLLIFDSFWLKRKFKLKGIESRILYPLYLDKGSTHWLNIDLNHFYSYDKKLKKYSKITIKIFSRAVVMALLLLFGYNVKAQTHVYNESTSSGMFFQGTDGGEVSNPVSDGVNSSANVAKSATDGNWQQIQYFPTFTPASGDKIFFSVYNPSNVGPGQLQFEYSNIKLLHMKMAGLKYFM